MCVCVHKTTSKKGILNLAGGCPGEAPKVKIQHESRKDEGLILTPCEPKGKFNQASSEARFGPQAHLLDFTYAAPNLYVFSVTKWWGLYLRWQPPMGVKISRGPSVCSTYGPEVVCLYSRAYEMFRREVSLLVWTRRGKKNISFTALFEHEALLSSPSPPPDLLSPGSVNGSFSAPLL